MLMNAAQSFTERRKRGHAAEIIKLYLRTHSYTRTLNSAFASKVKIFLHHVPSLLRHTFYFHAISQELLQIDIVNTPLELFRSIDVPFGGHKTEPVRLGRISAGFFSL